MRSIHRLIAIFPVSLALAGTGTALAGNLQQEIALANDVGFQSGKLYCAGKSARYSVEKGTAKAMAESSMSMDAINQIDFSKDVYTVPMIETFFAYTIDNCPKRAKRLWREINESM